MIEFRPDGVLFVRPFLAVTAGILVLFVGKAVNRRFGALREFNIPEPVTGGLLIAVALWLVYAVSGWRIVFDMAARDVLLVYFFAILGINARIGELRRGRRPLVMLLLAAGAFMLLQNTAGVLLAMLVGRPPALGLVVGSVSLLGGHGTAIGWAPAFVQKGIAGALEIGVLSATAGLVLGSLAAGPVARFLVQRYRLHPEPDQRQDVGVHYDEPVPGIDYFSFLHAWLTVHVAIIAGLLLHPALTAVGLVLPLFVPCLVAALIISNAVPRVAPRVAWATRTPALALIAEVSLGVFLAMSLMSMELWTLAVLAGPLLLMLLVQGVLLVAFAVLVVFRVLGRNYDAAVMCAGFIGFGVGATPTAMANMTAITQRHGPSHLSFIVVPVVSAFFIDVLNNMFVIRAFWRFCNGVGPRYHPVRGSGVRARSRRANSRPGRRRRRPGQCCRPIASRC
jgi:glutamate:Na+ symporter, ESS family